MSGERTDAALLAVAQAEELVPRGTVWLHKKGGVYVVCGYVLNTDSGTAMVRYRRIGGPDHDPKKEAPLEFARPLEQWSEDRFVPFTGKR